MAASNAQHGTAVNLAGNSDKDSSDEKDDADDFCTEMNTTGGPECSICLQPRLHPVKLPCGHVFCFLCIKGVAARDRRCALCRRDIPFEYFDNPTVVQVGKDGKALYSDDEYKWYYEGRNGWWQYDERASAQLEEAFSSGKRACELPIAGFFYVVDIANMFQYRRNNPSRKRRIKRDRESAEKKGIAGLKLVASQDGADSPSSDILHRENEDTVAEQQPVSGQVTKETEDALVESLSGELSNLMQQNTST